MLFLALVVLSKQNVIKDAVLAWETTRIDNLNLGRFSVFFFLSFNRCFLSMRLFTRSAFWSLTTSDDFYDRIHRSPPPTVVVVIVIVSLMQL